jgi:hypothetical protein
MNAEFASIHNHHERAVFDAVRTMATNFPLAASEPALLADVACVALNRLPPRYIRHEVDLAFYLTEKERIEMARAVEEAVRSAFEFVQARKAMRARA